MLIGIKIWILISEEILSKDLAWGKYTRELLNPSAALRLSYKSSKHFILYYNYLLGNSGYRRNDFL